VLVIIQPHTRLQIPGKFFDYICFKKPIFAIGERGSALERMIMPDFGNFIDYNAPQAIQDAILSYTARAHKFPIPKASKLENYNMRTTVKKFEKILDR
jgi:hypothetical protein